MSSLLVRGGRIVTATDSYLADILVIDGVVSAIGEGGNWSADREIDATGLLVLPGGVDTHTHFEHMSANGNTRTADDFASGSMAAIFGGTTTVVDFVRRQPGETVTAAFERRMEQADSGSVVDYGFHPIVPAAALEDGSFDELLAITEKHGTTSWKFFMAYHGQMVSDDVLIHGIRLAHEHGVLPMVHAENGHLVAAAIDEQLAEGHTDEHFHLFGHPASAEREAIHRAATIATWVDSPLFVVHVSSPEGANEVRRFQDRGMRIMAETCPQYLVTSYEQYENLGFDAAKFVCSPPIREQANQAGLWRAVEDGTFGSIGTDHAAFTIGQPDDLPPQKPQGRGYFPSIPNGVPGVEERLMVMNESAVNSGRISMNRFVDLVATQPAKTFGLYPRKGTVAPGSDADLVIWDPTSQRTLSASTHHSRADYSIYEGMTVTGAPRTVIARGEVVIDDGKYFGQPARGEYLARARFE
jgi:dihydropyrimidinase